MPAAPPIEDASRWATEFENSRAEEVLAWAGRQFGGGLVLTASFEDAVLVHLVAQHAPLTDVVLLDTQYLFPEVLAFVEDLRERFSFRLQVLRPAPGVVPNDLWKTDVEACCGLRKVEPLERALAGRAAWVTGIRRVDGPTRANAPEVGYDVARDLVKINPLARWSDDDLRAYEQAHDLPENPLLAEGYVSIGCWPCTRPVQPGEDRRAGRWAGQDKTECGLHK